MPRDESEVMLQVGRAFRLMQGWVEAGLVAQLRETVLALYGRSFEHRLMEVLLESRESLPLYEIAAKCGLSRRAVLQTGSLRKTLEGLARDGILTNTGTKERPRYALNHGDDRVRFIEGVLRSEARTPGP